MAGPQSLASASGRDAAAQFRYANVAQNEHLNGNELCRLQPGAGAGARIVEGSLAFQTGDQQLVIHDHDKAVHGFAVTIPTDQRFAIWSLQYLLVLASRVALVGGIAAAVPASMSDTPAILRQARAALNEGHGALFKLGDDPRITRLATVLRDFSLDELCLWQVGSRSDLQRVHIDRHEKGPAVRSSKQASSPAVRS